MLSYPQAGWAEIQIGEWSGPLPVPSSMAEVRMEAGDGLDTLVDVDFAEYRLFSQGG